MRFNHVTRVFFVTTALAGLVASAQDKAAIQKKLEATYALTQATADRTDIVTAGAILVLQKSNLVMTDATKSDINQNKYQDGKFTQNVFGKLARMPHFPGAPAAPAASATRTFVKGEKMWVTKIDVKDNAVVFELFTDQMGDYRYRALLTFFGKGALPSPDQVAATIAEVFTVQPAENAAPTADQRRGACSGRRSRPSCGSGANPAASSATG